MTLPPLRQIFQDMALSLVFFTRLPLKDIDFGRPDAGAGDLGRAARRARRRR